MVVAQKKREKADGAVEAGGVRERRKSEVII